MKLIDSIRRYFGWRNWAVLRYNSVLENIFVVFYIALRKPLYGRTFLTDIAVFVLLSVFSTTYGYLINDWADKDLDARHGKDNTFQNDSAAKAALITGLFGLLALLCLLRFASHPFVTLLWLLWFFIATAYSVKPLRLKERGKAGLALVVVAQRVLPTLLIFAAFRHAEAVDVVLITLYILFRGLSSDLNHQLEDYRLDSTTHTGTYAVNAGISSAENVFRLSLEVEKLLLLFVLGAMLIHLKPVRIAGMPAMAPALFFYGILYGLSVLSLLRRKDAGDVNPFIGDRKNIFQFLHHAFPSVLLPGYLLLLLVFKHWLFAPVLLLFMLYRKLYSFEMIRNSFPVRLLIGAFQGLFRLR